MIIHFGLKLIRGNHPMLPRITMLAYYLSSADQTVRKILYYENHYVIRNDLILT